VAANVLEELATRCKTGALPTILRAPTPPRPATPVEVVPITLPAAAAVTVDTEAAESSADAIINDLGADAPASDQVEGNESAIAQSAPESGAADDERAPAGIDGPIPEEVSDDAQ
jgi:hypothetical protein